MNTKRIKALQRQEFDLSCEIERLAMEDTLIIAKQDQALMKKMPKDPMKMTKKQVEWLLRPAFDTDPRLTTRETLLQDHRRFQVNYMESMGFGNLGSTMDTDMHIGIILSRRECRKHPSSYKKYLEMFLNGVGNDSFYDTTPTRDALKISHGLKVVVPCENTLRSAIITKKSRVLFFRDGTDLLAREFSNIESFLRVI